MSRSRKQADTEPAASPTKLTEISGNHLSMLAWALRRRNMDVDAIFQEAGAFAPNSNTPISRVPLFTVVRILKIIQRETGDPVAALKVYRSLKLTHFDLLGIALSCSESLIDFFYRAQRFCSYVGPGFQLEITGQDNSHIICGRFNKQILLADPEADSDDVYIFMQCVAYAVIGILRDLFDEPVPMQQIYLAGTPPEAILEAFEEVSGAPVMDRQSFIGARIETKVLTAALPGQNPALARNSDQQLTEQLADLEKNDIVRQCEKLITEGMMQGSANLNDIARQLGTSESGLRRKLQKRGLHFSDLVTNIKKSLAIQHLREGQLRISEIAYMLGFDSPSNFSRAFRSWTGDSPSQYKKHPSS